VVLGHLEKRGQKKVDIRAFLLVEIMEDFKSLKYKNVISKLIPKTVS